MGMLCWAGVRWVGRARARVGVVRRAVGSTARLHNLGEEAIGGDRDGGGELVQTEWSPGSQRCGALGMKCGMMSLFDGYGVRRTVTVMLLDELEVTQVKSPPHDEVTALQVGLGTKRAHRVPKSVRKHFEHNGLPVKQKVAQFSVTPDALMPVGTRITARHFVPGQFVDVQVRVHQSTLPECMLTHYCAPPHPSPCSVHRQLRRARVSPA